MPSTFLSFTTTSKTSISTPGPRISDKTTAAFQVMEHNPPPPRHLGRVVRDLVIDYFLSVSPRALSRAITMQLARTSGTQQIVAAAVAIVSALAQYQHTDYFPTAHELAVGLTSLIGGAVFVATVLALEAWVEEAVWPWQEQGWMWPWERWVWACTVGGTEGRESSDSDSAVEVAVEENVTERLKEADVGRNGESFDVVGTEDVQHLKAEKNDGDHEKQDSSVVPLTPSIPERRQSYKIIPSKPVHHSGLLGESPMPMSPKYLVGNLFARRADARAAMNDWSRPGATAAEKAEALRIMEESREQESEVKNEEIAIGIDVK